MSSNEKIADLRIRGSHWGGIANKIRDCATTGHIDMDEWCMEQARICWARQDEAYAIAKQLEKENDEL